MDNKGASRKGPQVTVFSQDGQLLFIWPFFFFFNAFVLPHISDYTAEFTSSSTKNWSDLGWISAVWFWEVIWNIFLFCHVQAVSAFIGRFCFTMHYCRIFCYLFLNVISLSMNRVKSVHFPCYKCMLIKVPNISHFHSMKKSKVCLCKEYTFIVWIHEN